MLIEERLLIGGQLRDAAGGRTYENINPATEEVVGGRGRRHRRRHARSDRRRSDAFDDGAWAADPAFRARCLRQLHEALLRHAPEIRATIRAEVGATEASLSTALFDRALDNLTVRRGSRRELRVRTGPRRR